MNIYRNRLSYDFDSQGNTIDAMVGFNGMNDQGETTMATIKIKQIKSKIGAPKDQKETLKVLGLHRIGEVVEREDNAVTRGQINKVHHLVTVVE